MKKIEEIKQESSSFCMLPFMHFYGTAAGNIVPCCEAQEIYLNSPEETAEQTWNNKNFRGLRRSLSNGERPDICQVCWHNEDSGIMSNRVQFLNDDWDNFKDDIQLNDDFSVDNPPLWIELKVSNFCNLKCIMCSTHSSYKRVADLDIIKKYSTSGYTDKLFRPTELFKDIGDWNIWESVRVLQFTGGEPIINQEHYDLLDSIPKNIRHKIKLRYATNISYIKFKKYDLIEIWKQFKSVNLKVSMDGIDDVYNYIRQDGDWDTVYENMCVLDNVENITLAAGITVQAHNIFHLPEFFKFWQESPISLGFITANVLQTPNYLNPAVWHTVYADAIISRLKSHVDQIPQLQKFITYMENNKDQRPYAHYMRFRKYTRDIENRYQPPIRLDDMVKKYLDMDLENMNQVFHQQRKMR